MALGQAHVCADTWLTGAKIDAQSARQYQNTVSCDQLMAEVTSKYTRFASLELVHQFRHGAAEQFCYAGLFPRRRAAAGRRQRRATSSTASSARTGAASRLSAPVSPSAAACWTPCSTTRSPCAATLGTDDRTKLDEYLHSVRDVEQRTERLDAWLERAQAEGGRQAPFQRDVSKAQAGEYWRTMFDLIVLALRTDMTRVVTYMNGSEGNGLAIPEIGITQSRHSFRITTATPWCSRGSPRATPSSCSSSPISSTGSKANETAANRCSTARWCSSAAA